MSASERDEMILEKKSGISEKETINESKNKYPRIIRKVIWWIGGVTAIFVALVSFFDNGQKLAASATTFLAKMSGYFPSNAESCTWNMTWKELQECERRR